jgi:hypothetical protein
MFRVPELFEWCFRDNLLNFLHIINVEFSDKAERLFEFLRIMSIIETGKNLGIENLKEKIKSEFSSWNRFKSFSSELLFANKFKENGFSVKLILDNDWTKNKIGVKAPDFMIENSNLKCLVEVVRINQDYIPGIIIDNIAPLCQNFPFIVTLRFTKALAHPKLDNQSRKSKENIANQCIEKIREVLHKADYSSVIDSETIEIAIEGKHLCSVELRKASKGYLSGYYTDAFVLSDEELIKQLEKEIRHKSKKRDTWNSEDKRLLFIIAVDIQEPNIHYWHLLNFLYGGRSKNGKLLSEADKTELGLIDTAKQSVWSKFLEELGFSASTGSPVTKPGYLIRDRSLMKHITGILVHFPRNNEYYYYPNPFAEETINSFTLYETISTFTKSIHLS